MRNILAILALLFAVSAHAGPLQKMHCTASTSCALSNAATAGDMLLVVEDAAQQPSDAQHDTFASTSVTGWYGTVDGVYYTTTAGGQIAVQFPQSVGNIYLAEYPPGKFDVQSPLTMLCCSPSANVGPVTTTGSPDLLVVIVDFAAGKSVTLPGSTGLVVEDTGTDFTVEDESVSPGTYSVSVPSSLAWGARVIAFIETPVTPPPPPPVIDTLTFSVQLANCTKCDGTDYAPLASASIYQGSSFLLSQDAAQICRATFNANAQASCSGGINVAPQFINLSPTITTSANSFVGPTASFPSLLAQGAVTGNVKLIIGFDAGTMVPRAVQVYTQ